MKTYLFEGVEHVESGEHRYPLKGEIFRFDDEICARKTDTDFCVFTCYILIPKEASMKYKQTDKKLSRMSVWEAIEDKTCEDALRDYSKFDQAFKASFWRSTIPYNDYGGIPEGPTVLYNYIEQNPHLYPWLVRHGFLEEIKPAWKPVALMIETAEEYAYLWHRLNLIPKEYEKVYTSTTDNPIYPKNADVLNNKLWVRLEILKESK